MLLSQQNAQQLWPVFTKNLSWGNHRVVRETKRDHQRWMTVACDSMMDGEHPLRIPDNTTALNTTPVAITRQHYLSIAGIVCLILPLEAVTRRAKAQCKHFLTAAGTTKRALHKAFAHFPPFELLFAGGTDGVANACRRFLIGFGRTVRSMVESDTPNVAAISALVS